MYAFWINTIFRAIIRILDFEETKSHMGEKDWKNIETFQLLCSILIYIVVL